MTPRTIASVTVVAGVLSLGLTACGDSGPSASDIVTKAKKDATSAKSASMAVQGSVQGQTVKLDATGTLDGKNQRQLQSAAKLKSEQYVVGNTAYFKANSDFLTSNGMNPKQVKNIADKWWSKSLAGGQQGASADVKGMLTQFFNSADGKKLASGSAKVKKTTTRGQQTYTISSAKGDGPKLITTRAKNPQVVEIQDYASQLTQNTKATYLFSQWNQVHTFTAPSGSKPIEQASGAKSSGSTASK